MSAPIVPVDRIDASWTTDVLTAAGVLQDGARVVEVHREPCGTGQLADSYRFTFTYDRPGAGPVTLVGKFPSDDAASRAFGKQSGYYKHEVLFYEQVAPRLDGSVAIPTPVHAALDSNETDFVLLMTDLAPARTVDQLHGCSADEAAAVVEQMAALHAGSWQDPQLADTVWLRGTTASFAHVTDNFPRTTAGFREIAGDLVPDDQIAEAARLNDHLHTWKTILSRPRCLWHSDLRADNLLFDACHGTAPERLVLRMDPLESIVETCRYREDEVFAAAAGVIPTPTTRFLDGDGTHLGRPGIVTGFIAGVTKPPTSGAVVSGVGTTFTPEWREKISGQWRDDYFDPYPLMTLAERWLRERLPAVEDPHDLVLLHGDYRVGNFLFDAESGRFNAVLDWELAQLCDFHEDLGWFTQRLFMGVDKHGNELCGDLIAKDDLVAAYQAGTRTSAPSRSTATSFAPSSSSARSAAPARRLERDSK